MVAAPAVPALIKILEGDDPSYPPVRPRAAEALGAIGPSAAASIPVLEKQSLRDESVREEAAAALKKIR